MERNWSEQQKGIFDFFATGRGNLVVRARAGTGKTTTIIEATKHAPNDAILLAAFNKRIAAELTARIPSNNVEAKTLHGLGFKFVTRQWQGIRVDATVDRDRALAACGADVPSDMLAMVMKLVGVLKGSAPFEARLTAVVQLAISNDCEPDEEEWAPYGWHVERVAKCAIAARDAAKVRDTQGRISFDDMIYIPIACGFARPWYTLVVIDEAQDMNFSQILLAQRACKRAGRVVVVGDDRQAIYGFRGADSGSIDRLKNELRATELGLTCTYRCGKKIVELAAKVVPDFTAADSNPEGVIDELTEGKLPETAQPGDFILSRKNAPLMSICLALLRKGIPARIEGRDIAATIQTTIRKLKAKSVPDFIARVGGWAKKQTIRAEKLSDEAAREAKAAQIADEAETLIALAEGCASVDEIVTRVATLFGDSEDGVPRNMVVCSSVHKAKGLEADRVFVLAKTVNTRTDEEANIYYVAVTRAKHHLTFVS